jgi:hypothetical protein
VKRSRVAERLVGTFDFTHATRSFDGARIVHDTPWTNVTALAVRPTHGGFELSANREIEDVGLAGLAVSLKRLPAAPPVDARLFYLYYEDRRRLPKVDNGGGATDPSAIRLSTIGGHATTAIDAGPGIVDLLLWGAVQTGDWGEDHHAAWAYAGEVGYQLPRLPWAPWLRAGIDHSSGDGAPRDGDHDTFFQILPTARTYAQLPFFTQMNLRDVFVSLLARPHERVALRSDWHWLRLSEAEDLWYAGGGAQNDDVFGFAGVPARGRHDLGQLVDLSATLAVTRQVAFAAYYGHAFGGGAVGHTFEGRDADYGFVEMTLRY